MLKVSVIGASTYTYASQLRYLLSSYGVRIGYIKFSWTHQTNFPQHAKNLTHRSCRLSIIIANFQSYRFCFKKTATISNPTRRTRPKHCSQLRFILCESKISVPPIVIESQRFFLIKKKTKRSSCTRTIGFSPEKLSLETIKSSQKPQHVADEWKKTRQILCHTEILDDTWLQTIKEK